MYFVSYHIASHKQLMYDIENLYSPQTTTDTIQIEDKKLIRRWDSERKLFYGVIFNRFYAVRPGSCRIRWNNAK